jgi:phage shock protein E
MKRVCCALSAFAICLLISSCGNDRHVPVSKHGTVAGPQSLSNGEAPSQVKPVVIDARSPQEYAGGHLEGALLMPFDTIGSMIEAQVPNRSTPILLYCRSGSRSEMARKTLVSMNYTRVENLGGMQSAASALKKEVVK